MSLEKIGRGLAMVFCKAIYSLIPSIYSVFYNLANARFLTNETVSRLSSNLYILISVVMLFTFSASLLSAIVNPDLINDKKKGVGAVFKRAIIGIMLIVLIPFAFNEAYKIQERIMSNSLIEKVIVGISYDTVECEEDEKDEDGLCPNKGGNGGQVIAGTLISAVLYPVEDGIEVDVEGAEEAYSNMVTKDISKYIKTMAKYKYINAAPKGDNAGDHEFAFEFNGLLAIIAGGATVYILLLYAMDTAVRMFKLAFFELTAPISVIAYVAAGPDTLKKWATEVGKTYVEVFVRIAGMAIYLFLMSNLDGFLSNIPGKTFFLKVVLVIGMLIFIKQLPDIVNRAFGTNWQTKGGIGGRLGSMAVVGDTAKKAWDTVKKGLTTVGLTAGALAAAPGLAIGAGAAGWAIGHGWKKGFGKNGTAWKDTTGGQRLATIGKTAGAFLGSGNPIKGISAAGKVIEESGFGKQKQTDKAQRLKTERNTDWKNNASKEAQDILKGMSAADILKKYKLTEKDLQAFKDNGNSLFDKNGHVLHNFGNLEQQALKNMMKNDKRFSTQQKLDYENLIDANMINTEYNKIKDTKSNLLTRAQNLANNSKNQNHIDALNTFQNRMDKGDYTKEEAYSAISNLQKNGAITGDDAIYMRDQLGKMVNSMESKITLGGITKAATEFDLSSVMFKDGKMNIGGAFTGIINNAKDDVDTAKAEWDTSKENAATEINKEQMGRYESRANEMYTQAMLENADPGRDGNTNYNDRYNKENQSSTGQPTSQTTSSTSGDNSTTSNQSSNEAYNNYANGGVGGNTSSGGGLGIDPFAAQQTTQQQPTSASQPSQSINEAYNNYVNGGVGGNSSNSDSENQTISSQNVTINATQANVTSQNATVSGSKFEFNGTGSMDGESGGFDKAADKIVKAVNQNTEATTQASKEEIQAEKSSSENITQQLKSNQIIDDRNDKKLNDK